MYTRPSAACGKGSPASTRRSRVTSNPAVVHYVIQHARALRGPATIPAGSLLACPRTAPRRPARITHPPERSGRHGRPGPAVGVLPCDTGYVASYVTAAVGAGGLAPLRQGVCAGTHGQCSEAGPRLKRLVVSARRQHALPRRHGECRPCPLGRPPGPGMARAGAPGASRCRAAGSQTRRGVRGRG